MPNKLEGFYKKILERSFAIKSHTTNKKTRQIDITATI
jgi:hypothetical protein